jgi:tetratricopeptide (TPR) repeat protein
LSAAWRADGLLAGADVDEALRQRVRARLADLELLDSLENIRLERETAVKDGHFDSEWADGLYGQTFRDAGLDVEVLPVEEAAERIRQSTVAAELAAVLDHWASIRRKIRGADDSSWKHFLEVARAADSDTWRRRVRQALERRDEQALLAVASSEEVFRLSPATLSVLGLALLEDKHALGQAEAFLREAQRRHPNDFWLNINLYHYFSLMQPPQREEAFPFAAVAVALRPRSPGAHLNLGVALRDKGLLDAAIAEYREAIRLKKDYADAHYNLSIVLHDKVRLDEAEAECREALRLKKDDHEAHYNLSRVLLAKGRLDEAEAECREALRLKKDYPEAHNSLGSVLEAKGRLDEAEAECREAIRLKKDYPEAHNNLGVALKAKGCLDEAIAEFRQALQIRKDDPLAHYNLGCALHNKGQLDGAIAEYRKALRLKKDYAEAHGNLGVALRDKGQLDAAIAEYREVLRIKKDDATAHVNLGVALHNKGQLDEAIAEYREVLRIKKGDAKAHYNLGLALRAKGQLDEAIAAYRQAVQLKKDYPEAHGALGQALLQQGRFAEARDSTRRCLDLLPPGHRLRPMVSQQLQQCERLLTLEKKLPQVLAGKLQPDSAADRLGFAQLCQRYRKSYLAAVRFYAEAFAAEPTFNGDKPSKHRYNAACAAALAGCGQGQDADKLDAKERVRLRQQALDWLRADLKAYGQVMEKAADKAVPALAQRMRHWLRNTDFAGVCGADALDRLPEAERLRWQKLWEEVEALRKRAAGKPPTATPARP